MVLTLLVLGGILLLITALLVWARGVWRKHEEESIYDTDPRAESHKKDAGFQSQLGHLIRGGP